MKYYLFLLFIMFALLQERACVSGFSISSRAKYTWLLKQEIEKSKLGFDYPRDTVWGVVLDGQQIMVSRTFDERNPKFRMNYSKWELMENHIPIVTVYDDFWFPINWKW